MLNKNDEIEINITGLGKDGEGIGHTEEGMTVFVLSAIPGDKVIAHITKAKKTFAYAFAKEILVPSKDRVTPKCPVAKTCGGCSLQHLSYEAQLKMKQEHVKDCIERIGGYTNPPMEEIIGCDNPYNYRNKAQFPVGIDKEGKTVIGFYRHHSHDVVHNTSCDIQEKNNKLILECVEKFLNTEKVSVYNEETGNGLVRHIFTRYGKATNEYMVCLVINGERLPKSEKLIDGLLGLNLNIVSICLNINKKNTNVILGNECVSLHGNLWIEDNIGEVRYRISPLSFYQVNPEQTKKLYDTALEFAELTGNEVVWDLYCGIGTISLFLARAAKKVYGVEIVPEAIEDAKTNARINGINNAEFFVGAAEDVADTLPAPDTIVVDPPRKGCDVKLLETITKVNPRRLVYVSCDPATLARDIKYLAEKGYKLEKVKPVDQFCHSMHVETVVLMSRRDK